MESQLQWFISPSSLYSNLKIRKIEDVTNIMCTSLSKSIACDYVTWIEQCSTEKSLFL